MFFFPRAAHAKFVRRGLFLTAVLAGLHAPGPAQEPTPKLMGTRPLEELQQQENNAPTASDDEKTAWAVEAMAEHDKFDDLTRIGQALKTLGAMGTAAKPFSPELRKIVKGEHPKIEALRAGNIKTFAFEKNPEVTYRTGAALALLRIEGVRGEMELLQSLDAKGKIAAGNALCGVLLDVTQRRGVRACEPDELESIYAYSMALLLGNSMEADSKEFMIHVLALACGEGRYPPSHIERLERDFTLIPATEPKMREIIDFSLAQAKAAGKFAERRAGGEDLDALKLVRGSSVVTYYLERDDLVIKSMTDGSLKEPFRISVLDRGDAIGHAYHALRFADGNAAWIVSFIRPQLYGAALFNFAAGRVEREWWGLGFSVSPDGKRLAFFYPTAVEAPDGPVNKAAIFIDSTMVFPGAATGFEIGKPTGPERADGSNYKKAIIESELKICRSELVWSQDSKSLSALLSDDAEAESGYALLQLTDVDADVLSSAESILNHRKLTLFPKDEGEKLKAAMRRR